MTDEQGVPTFADLELGESVLKAIDEMGWQTPTPVQWESYGLAASGADLIVQARTGTGKTGAFGIPLVDKLVSDEGGAQALILAPTRELALQSAREISKLGVHSSLNTTAVYGGASMEKQIKELKRGSQIISGTPGRVLDHLRRGTLDASALKILVLDEADEMLSMGFAKELNAILELLPNDRQTMLFSATVDGPVQRIAERHMRDAQFLTLSGDHVGALGIDHCVYMVSGVGRTRDLVSIIERENPESAIVFCNTKAETEEVAVGLQQAGLNAEWLNGDLPQRERERILERTRREDLRFLVATDVAARGIDVSHLTHVVNHKLPEHIEQYVHRTGRTGRAGRTGTAITLVGPAELGTLYYLRLQYGIVPEERSLSASGSHKTEVEAEQLAQVARVYGGAAEPTYLALARRLLTHPDAERIVASLLQGADTRGTGAATGSSADAAALSSESQTDEEAPTEGAARGARGDWSTLHVNVGREHNVRGADLGRLLRDTCDLKRRDVGRIRVRESHSFVDVPSELADSVIDAVTGQELGGNEVTLSLAKRAGASSRS